MGRPAKSTEEHIKDGTYQPCRHDNRGITMDALDELPPPLSLNRSAVEKWNEIVPAMLSAGLITVVDKEMLIDAFNNYAIAQDCINEVNGYNGNYGDYLKNLNKFKDVNLIDEYNSHMDRFNKIMMKFGVTPESRAKIRVKPKEKDTGDFFRSLMGNG